jgi:hypothetical protein
MKDIRLQDADDAQDPYRHNAQGNSNVGPRQIGVAHPAPSYLWKLLSPAEHRILLSLHHIRREVA